MLVSDRIKILTTSVVLWVGLLLATLYVGHVLALKVLESGHGAAPAAHP